MNIIEKTYSVFLCLTRDDRFGDRHKRAAMALEMVTTFFFSFIIMIIIGLLNLKITNILLWGLIIALTAFVIYLFFNRYLIKSERYIGIVEEVKQYSKKKKIYYAFLSVFLVVFLFVF